MRQSILLLVIIKWSKFVIEKETDLSISKF